MELKLRARIKENGKPIMFYQNDQYLISFLRRVTSFLAFEHDDKEGRHESYLDDHALEKCLDLYTGLTDENEKKIYIGDIVSGYIPNSESDLYFENGIVKFEEGECCIYNNIGYIGDLSSCSLNNSIKIVGNIYLDSHLIKQKNE